MEMQCGGLQTYLRRLAKARPDRVADALARLMVDGPEREAQRAGLARVRERLGCGDPTARVCAIAEELLGADRA